MEFVIKQSALKEVLGFVQGVVERKSTIPVLSNILIESLGENSIRIVGTDLDVTIRCDAEADIKTGGAMCIQARKLFDLARLLNGDTVKFKKEVTNAVLPQAAASSAVPASSQRSRDTDIKSSPRKPCEVSITLFTIRRLLSLTSSRGSPFREQSSSLATVRHVWSPPTGTGLPI